MFWPRDHQDAKWPLRAFKRRGWRAVQKRNRKLAAMSRRRNRQ